MTTGKLSATDTALRQRLTELCVHIPCGGLRGPVQRESALRPDLPVRWQSCPDEDSPEVWPECDVSREHDLCIVCDRATAGGTTRWAWLACRNCRAVNSALEEAWGFRPLALGRHSLMNGIGVKGGAAPEEQEDQVRRLANFAKEHSRLADWRRDESARLARAFDPLADVPLRTWQRQWPPSRAASIDAFSRLLETELPLR